MRRLSETGGRVWRAFPIAATMAIMASQGSAQTASTPRPVGRVSIEQAQLAFIGSAAVGGGTLFYRGQEHGRSGA